MGLTLTKLSIRDYLGIEQVELSGLGKILLVEGRNAEGKTSVLNAIKEAMISSGADPTVIRAGKEKAEILLELQPEHIEISRKITPNANTVSVKVDGQPVRSPQAFLDKLRGQSSINPVAFFLAPKRKRREILLQAIALKMSPAEFAKKVWKITGLRGFPDAELKRSLPTSDGAKEDALTLTERWRQTTYDLRHSINVDATRLRKAIEQDRQELPDKLEPIAIEDLQRKRNELQAAVKEQVEYDEKIAEERMLKDQQEAIEYDIKQLEAQINLKKKRWVQNNKSLLALESQIKGSNPPDGKRIQQELAELEAIWEQGQRHRDILRRQTELEVIEVRAEKLDTFHKGLAKDVPQVLLKEAKMPCEGLMVEGETISIGGIAIDRLSGREQVEFAMMLTRATAGNLKVIVVDGLELLDTKNLKLFKEEIDGDDFQYVLAKVSDSGLEFKNKIG